jgi:predicted CopG family antitoxin
MKTINETFTDEEYEMLLRYKGSLTWHDFIMKIITFEKRISKLEKQVKEREDV